VVSFRVFSEGDVSTLDFSFSYRTQDQ